MTAARTNVFHSKSIRRYGFIPSNHRRRYQCKECHRTFAWSYGTIYYRGRLDQREVRTLLDSIVLSTSVIASAKEASVSKNTAMRYRRILLGFVEKADKKPVLSKDGVQVDETYLTLYGMIGNNPKKGIFDQKEGIAIGTDATNKVCLKDIGPGHPTSKTLKDAWEGKIAEGSTLTHDSLHGYQLAFESSNPRKENWINLLKPEEEKALDHINQLCSGVKWFLRKHHGIRKANLDSYLCWYEILFNLDPSEGEFENMVLGSILQKKTGINT
jgi:transposase-like protein